MICRLIGLKDWWFTTFGLQEYVSCRGVEVLPLPPCIQAPNMAGFKTTLFPFCLERGLSCQSAQKDTSILTTYDVSFFDLALKP